MWKRTVSQMKHAFKFHTLPTGAYCIPRVAEVEKTIACFLAAAAAADAVAADALAAVAAIIGGNQKVTSSGGKDVSSILIVTPDIICTAAFAVVDVVATQSNV